MDVVQSNHVLQHFLQQSSMMNPSRFQLLSLFQLILIRFHELGFMKPVPTVFGWLQPSVFRKMLQAAVPGRKYFIFFHLGIITNLGLFLTIASNQAISNDEEPISKRWWGED